MPEIHQESEFSFDIVTLQCILVKGWKSSSGWGFPKGKINEHEAPHDCAAREVCIRKQLT